MEELTHTSSATQLVEGVNGNLQDMGSAVVLTTSMSASQMVSALNAEFYGIDGVTELTTDMDAEDFVTALNGNFELAGAGVKAQFEAEAADTVSKVNALDSADALVFLLCTDVHYNPTEYATPAAGFTVGLEKIFDDSAVNMRAVSAGTDIDFLFCLGDIIDGNSDTTRSTNEAAHMMAKLQSVGKPLYIAIGNHDNNKNGKGSSVPSFSRSTMKSMFMDKQSQDVIFANASYKSDYYKDFSSQGIRMIVIYGNANSDNGSNYLYDEATRTFLQSSLASMPDGYKAIVMTHVPPMTKMNYDGNLNDDIHGAVRNGGENIPSGESVASIKDIILNAGSKVIAMFYGHCHQDNVWADPFVCIGTCCNKGSFGNGNAPQRSEDNYMPDRATDDETADLWDVVIVKPTAKRIDMVRFGAGVDRIVHYEPVECGAGKSLSTALVPASASGGNWILRTSDNAKASVRNGVVTVNSGVAKDTLISVIYTDKDPDARISGTTCWAKDSGGNYMEYWTIKVS